MSELYNPFFGRTFTLGSLLKVSIPARRDARYALLLFQLVYVLYILFSPEFVRSYQQYLVSISACLIFDLLLQLTYYRKISVFPLSSIITGHGIFLLVYSPDLWPYIFISFVSIFLKFTLKWKGIHIFNPNNIGIVLAVLLFQERINLTPGAWTGHNLIMYLIIALGIYVTIMAKRFILVTAFLLSFIFYGVLYWFFHSPENFWFYFYPLTGVAFQIYLFYMITDPITTPNNKKLQLLAGFMLAFFDFIFRIHEEKYSLIYASTCNVLLFSLVKIIVHYTKRKNEVVAG